MTLRELYDDIGGDYNQVVTRLGGHRGEQLLCKLVKMLPEDPSMKELEAALEKKDYEAAFRASHTYKGVVLNLGLTPVMNIAKELTEELRNNPHEEQVIILFQEMKQWNDKVLLNIAELI